jgi:hypothetical protein
MFSKTSLLWAAACWGVASAKFTPYLPQSFFFEWDTNPVPIPVNEQCEVLHIKWSRGPATGPNSQGPYFLQVYTSIYPTPFIINAGDTLSFDWAVPFPPKTLYQICMTDKNGNTGGCQRMMTVVASTTTTNPSCTNVTFPATPLDVTGTVIDGPFAQYGWIPQCSDLQLKPNNGTPPYTFTYATTLHPPYNITSNSMDAVNWTVPLSWASSFFVSVVDSAGNSWARGPLHSGSSNDPKQPPTCLSQISEAIATPGPTSSKGIKPVAAAGAGVGGIFVGLLLGLIPTYYCMRGRVKKAQEESELREKSLANLNYQSPNVTVTRPGLRPLSNPSVSVSSHVYSSTGGEPTRLSMAATTLGNRETRYQTEPFRMPVDDAPLSPSGGNYLNPSDDGSIYPSTDVDSQAGSRVAGSSQAGAPENRNQVYVVHHDGGRAPVTVFTPDGTQVVELPPQYQGGSAATDVGASSGGAGRLTLHSVLEQTRDAGPTPRKGRA